MATKRKRKRSTPKWTPPPEFPADETFDAAMSRIKSERQRAFVRALCFNRKSGTAAALAAGCNKCSAYARAGKWKRLPVIKHALAVWARDEAARLAHRQHVIHVVYGDQFIGDRGPGTHSSTRLPQYAPDGAEILVQFDNPDPELLRALASESPELIGAAALEALDPLSKSEQ